MKRAAFGLCAWLVLAGQVAMAQTPGGDEPAAPPGEEPASEPPSAEPPKEGDVQTPVEKVQAGSGSKYSDVWIVPRRPVLKRRRVELVPTYNVTINDTVIRHHGFGAMLNIYLSEAFFIGLEGTYYAKQLTDRYFLLGVDQRVLPSVNHYVFSALLDFGYVPIHGKFTFFNSSIVHWEVYIEAGVGVFQSEVIPRDPANTGFSSYLIAGLLPGIGTRMWLSRWFAIDAYIKNYIFADQLEPTSRVPGETGDMAAGRAVSQFTFDITFGLGLSIFLPPGFEYKTLR